MTILVVVLAIGIAVVLGYGVNRFIGQRDDTDPKEGSKVPAVLAPTSTVAAFLLALVLFGAASNFTESGRLVRQEAAVIDNLYEAAEYVADEGIRGRLHAATVCYVRAVISAEWPAFRNGTTSPVPSNWTGTGEFGIRRALLDLGPEGQGFSLVIAQDQKRGDLRSDRTNKLTPSTPAVIFAFLVIMLSLSIGAVALGIPRQGNAPHLMALVLVLVVYSGLMTLIYALDRPFSGGLLEISPAPMESAEADISEDYEEDYEDPLPCDEQGVPRGLTRS